MPRPHQMDRVAVDTTQVLVLADGRTPADVANRRGHVFEQFVAQLLTHYGYSEPRQERLNVISDGIELDVTAEHKLTGRSLVAECKAYSVNVAPEKLDQFLGKYALLRTQNEALDGFFIALPRLTGPGVARAGTIMDRFPQFKVLAAPDVVDKLRGAGLLPHEPDEPLLADPAVLVTEHGLAVAYRTLDPESRRAIAVRVVSANGSPARPLIELVEQSAYAEGLAVRSDPSVARTISIPVAQFERPDVVPVHGSSDDFEYQFPASPPYFIGRKAVVSRLVGLATKRGSGQVLVVNARSGWGKSSLALRVAQGVSREKGYALVVDSRTATRADFATAALEQLARGAAGASVLRIGDEAAFSSRSSALQTFASADWKPGTSALVFFDQFENVFRNEDLTRAFRDLALAVLELQVPLTVGFAWKTDLVGWTEGHPYQLRDAIRQAADVTVLDPWGPQEIDVLLGRLERRLDERLHPELRRRLREYSQGLPWLLKKLSGHIIREVRESGTTQEQLLEQDLNVQTLFESDLGELSPAEQQALRTIARMAPVVIAELEDVVPSEVLQSLLDRRLVVQISERADIYWDIFRDFLNSGRVAIEDSYIMRYSPQAVGRLLRALTAAGGSISVQDAAEELDTSSGVVFNLARELRLVGVSGSQPNRVVLVEEVQSATNRESAVRARVARALRRHKIHTLVSELLEHPTEPLSATRLAQEMPDAFAAVEAKPSSWTNYARAFTAWLHYAGLVSTDRDGNLHPFDAARFGDPPRLLTGSPTRRRLRQAFPQAPAGPAEDLLKHLTGAGPPPPAKKLAPAIRDLASLRAVEVDAADRLQLVDDDLVVDGGVNPVVLRRLMEALPGMTEVLSVLETTPWSPPNEIGQLLKDAYQAHWAEGTVVSSGKYARSWARLAGVKTRVKPPRPTADRGDATLFDAVPADAEDA